MSFDDLTDALTVKCFSFLSVEELLRAGAVSIRWNKLASSDNLWLSLVKYVSVPPQGAWKPRSVRDSEEEDMTGFGVTKSNERAEHAAKGEADRWTDDSAVAWLQKQKAKKIKVNGTSAYEVEGKESVLLGGKESAEKRPKRSPKATFLEFIGRGWYLPRFSVRSKSDVPAVSVQPSGSRDDAFSVFVNNKPWFKVGHADHTKPFEFARVWERTVSPPVYDASLVVGESVLPDQLNAASPLRVDLKQLSDLGSAFETGSYDVAYIKVWPQLIKTACVSLSPSEEMGAESSEPEAETERGTEATGDPIPERTKPQAAKPSNPGDFFSHEGAEWGFDAVPDGEHYYRCWTHCRKVSYENTEGNVTGQGALSAFVIPLQHPDNLNESAVESYIQEMNTDPLFLPSVLTLGCWDRRSFVDGEVPLVRFGSSLHLVNFLVGGHVQMAAAARLGRPVWILSFMRRASGPSESPPPPNADKLLLKLADTRWGQSPPRCEPLSIQTPLTRRRFYFVHLGVIWDTSAHDVAQVLRDHTLGLRPREVLVSLDTFEVVVQLVGASTPGETSVVERLFSEDDSSLRSALQSHKALRALGPSFIQVKLALPEEVDAIRRSPNRSEWVDRRSKNTRRTNHGRGRGGMSRGGKRFGGRGGGSRGRSSGFVRGGNRRGRGAYGSRPRGGRSREHVRSRRDSPILFAGGEQNQTDASRSGGSEEGRGGRGLCYFFFNTRQGCKFGDRCWFRHDSFPPAVPFLVDPAMAMMHQYPPLGMPGGPPLMRSPSPQGSSYPPMYSMMRSGSPLSGYPAGGMVYPGVASPEGYAAFSPSAASPEGYVGFTGSIPEEEYPPIHGDMENHVADDG